MGQQHNKKGDALKEYVSFLSFHLMYLALVLTMYMCLECGLD